MLKRAFGLVLVAGALSLALLARVSAHATPTVTDLLNWYDAGRYDDVIAELDRQVATAGIDVRQQLITDSFLREYDTAVRQWMRSADTTLQPHRRLVAATVALEIARSRKSGPVPPTPILAWACTLMRENPPVVATDAERLWYIASVAAYEDLSGWSMLSVQAAPAVARGRLTSTTPQPVSEAPSGHLAHALARFPHEPRLLLAEVEVRDGRTMGLSGMFGGDVLSIGQLRSDEISPTTVAGLRQRLASANPSSKALIEGTLARIESLPQIANGYAALAQYDEIRADVELRFGYVAARTLNWDRAIEHLALVPQFTHDTRLTYLSHYIRGWALQEAGRRSDAIDAYRHAVEIVPHVRSATSLLAAQMFLSDDPADRDQAYGVLDATYQISPPVVDPWTTYIRGDAPLWPAFMTQLREALK